MDKEIIQQFKLAKRQFLKFNITGIVLMILTGFIFSGERSPFFLLGWVISFALIAKGFLILQCPSCKKRLAYYNVKFCSHCGCQLTNDEIK